MRCLLHQVCILLGNLARLGNLQLLATQVVTHPERTTTRLALILHHAADTDRTVEALLHKLQRCTLRKLAAKLLTEELNGLSLNILATLNGSKQLERTLLKTQKLARKHTLICYGVGLALVGSHVVDVLHKDDVGIELIEVGDECSMTRRAEQKLAIVGAEWGVVGIYGNGVGSWALLRERHVELNAELLFVVALTLTEQRLETLLVLRRHGEVDSCTLAIRCIQRCLHQVLLNRLAVALLVGVERNQALRLSAILQTLYDDVAHNILVVDLWLKILCQLGEEGKLLEVYD